MLANVTCSARGCKCLGHWLQMSCGAVAMVACSCSGLQMSRAVAYGCKCLQMLVVANVFSEDGCKWLQMSQLLVDANVSV